ncbi:putative serine proteinase [Acetobacter aceti NRIC 0242]|uniref:Peptidase S8/S53 domain-containing protein n=1 Tax=Acetobacter aceti NBRC 14818 TaxID=887700 RepID=A0AB33I9V4_ACEAC|nr:S8 family serine peptidase [Acetobacter aceti]TCS35392.1 subtilase family protein [Acetobacter aceti NBRC 14818]BCK75220.1 hypothetical protein EMQ_0826 [Acetobacter aceti NBRC 14818]GAN57490.1 peptidase S8/S53 subtilisin kexin sedolisin [Acetobacter aceti NBRC 14818]GBO79482.1 putative serine proteinase [Acetobacter aceti NRIC 0242]
MDDAEYVIFESSPPPVNWALNGFRLGSAPIASDIAETLQTVTSVDDDSGFRRKNARPDLTKKLRDRSAPAKIHILNSPEAAAIARVGGQDVMRVPFMPIRLIPQFDQQASSQDGSAWGIEAMQAHHLPNDQQGQGVTVAILDTGIDKNHPAFKGLITEENYKDFTGNGLTDNVGHGTHCAGIIFGRPVNGQRIGIAPGVSRILVGKIADNNFVTTTKELREALTWAVSEGADIISLSVGLDFLGHKKALEDRGFSERVAMAQALNDYRDYTRFFDALMRTVVTPGVAEKSALVIAACGNDSDPSDRRRVPATLPAVADSVIAVSALCRAGDGSFSVAPFCNAQANICGPGVGILSAAPKRELTTMSGTSQAAPHVAGVAALWWQHLSLKKGQPPTPSEVRDELFSNANSTLITGESGSDNIGRGLALAPPPYLPAEP